MIARVRYPLISDEERAKVESSSKRSNDDGLYGQFPEVTSALETRKVLMRALFSEAQGLVTTILNTSAFDGFREYMNNPRRHVLVAKEISLFIKGEVVASPCVVIWSVPQRGNRLMLVIHENRLKLCTEEYIYQDRVNHGGIHWYRLYDDREKLEVDSERLHQALVVLSGPETAWKYLRAMVFSLEQSLTVNRS